MLNDLSLVEKMKPYITAKYKFTDIDWNVKPFGKFDSMELPAR